MKSSIFSPTIFFVLIGHLQVSHGFSILGRDARPSTRSSDVTTTSTHNAVSIPTMATGYEDNYEMKHKVFMGSRPHVKRKEGFVDYVDHIRKDEDEKKSSNNHFAAVLLKKALGLTSTADDGSVLMRDLFTSNLMSFLYERGWRQTFRFAGFPGPDQEAALAMRYFAPVWLDEHVSKDRIVVDMSCASGLFARRFAESGHFDHVLACDYSPTMLTELNRRVQAQQKNPFAQLVGRHQQGASNTVPTKTQLDLVRCDVGNIPMHNASVPAFHAGAAMHCWPDLAAALGEIHRVLPKGGRFFGTTFLAEYFRFLKNREDATGSTLEEQALHYFESTEEIRALFEQAGFSKISIEVLGRACVVIRSEK